ncbi:hypothetical protein K490DRAFT_39519, partial [Saccharata proteae CBS 121410]
SQDRYICSTCNKAFSRPSSLRIHSHNHAGETPLPTRWLRQSFQRLQSRRRQKRGYHAIVVSTPKILNVIAR